MRAVVCRRTLPRFVAARLAAELGSEQAAKLAPLRLEELAAPPLPSPEWRRCLPVLSGICGSDLSLAHGRTSTAFAPLVSFPFVPGHEVIATLADEPERRVVLEPVLSCATRAIEPPCGPCQRGETGNCELVAFGTLRPGLQTGFCASTGGGWGTELVAHTSQLHDVPDSLDERDAVMVEPSACAIHAAAQGRVAASDRVAVIGAGTVGLLVTAALCSLTPAGKVTVAARHPHQRRLADHLGAEEVVSPDALLRALRRDRRSFAFANPPGPPTSGADVVFDCVGTAESLELALEAVRPRGRVVLVGMPGVARVDLALAWYKEVDLVGAYTYGVEPVDEDGMLATEIAAPGTRSARTFTLALELVERLHLGTLVSAVYPLERFEEALAHASSAGQRGAVKIALDPRPRRRGTYAKTKTTEEDHPAP